MQVLFEQNQTQSVVATKRTQNITHEMFYIVCCGMSVQYSTCFKNSRHRNKSPRCHADLTWHPDLYGPGIHYAEQNCTTSNSKSNFYPHTVAYSK